MKINPKILALSMRKLIKLREVLAVRKQLEPEKYTAVYDMTQRAIEAKVI